MGNLGRVLAGILLALVLAACGSPTSPSASLEDHVRDFTGSGALNCGRLGKTASVEEMNAGLACALDASRAGRAFSVVREYQGIDSAVAEGLVAQPAGPISKFTFDSAPCGSPGRCGARFATEACPAPHVTARGSLTVFAC
jgi:hypothetical protein